MSQQHVPDDLLAAFVEGDVGEQLAVHIAEHLDECPRCLNLASGLEPLSHAFAALPDPAVPEDLVAAVLAEADQPERLPLTELGIGAALLAAASLIAAVFGNPVAMAAEFGLVLSAVGNLGRVVATGLAGSSVALTLVSAFAILGLVLTARLADPVDLSGLSGPRRLL